MTQSLLPVFMKGQGQNVSSACMKVKVKSAYPLIIVDCLLIFVEPVSQVLYGVKRSAHCNLCQGHG